MFKPIPKKEADAIVDKYMKELNVRPADPDRPVKNLSGGNQQKVLIGRWLATHPELLILDEPTRGIDIGAKAEIQQVVLDLASQGMGVVFISSELEEVVQSVRRHRGSQGPPQDRRNRKRRHRLSGDHRRNHR